MPFTNYQSVADVARSFQIRVRRDNFVVLRPVALSDYFRAELDFTLRKVPFDGPEVAVCETLIYPFLHEIWRVYLETLTLWSHQPIAYDTDLSGVSDYLLARRSPLGTSF